MVNYDSLRPEDMEQQHALQQHQTAEWYLACIRQRIQELPVHSVYDLDVEDFMSDADEQTRQWIVNEFYQAGWSEACFFVESRSGRSIVHRFTLAK